MVNNIVELKRKLATPEQLQKSPIKNKEKARVIPWDELYKNKKVFPLVEREMHLRFMEIAGAGYHVDHKNGMPIKTAMDVLNSQNPKGIIMSGPVGTGKTALFRILMELFLFTPSRFIIANQRVIIRNFQANGEQVIDYYSEFPGLCIDDFGFRDEEIKRYGNACNVIEEIIYERHRKGKFTHITTNLTKDQIFERFGERLNSRIKASSVLINLNGKNYRNG